MRIGACLALLLLQLAAAPARADLLKESIWLPPGSTASADLLSRPREILRGGEHQSFLAEFGRLAFRSPEIMGGNARRAGISCNACHTNGDVNRNFFVAGLSDRPGRVDVTHAFWNARNEDGASNPLAIPSLRGVAGKARLGHDGRSISLREFTRIVMVVEFAAAEPAPVLLDALLAYQTQLGADSDQSSARVDVTLGGDLADFQRYLNLLDLPLREEDGQLAAAIVPMIRFQAGLLHERFPADLTEERRLIEDWSERLRKIGQLIEAQSFLPARSELATLRESLPRDGALLRAAEPRSLYDPETLRRALSR